LLGGEKERSIIFWHRCREVLADICVRLDTYDH
jgi:hypothetical protein